MHVVRWPTCRNLCSWQKKSYKQPWLPPCCFELFFSFFAASLPVYSPVYFSALHLSLQTCLCLVLSGTLPFSCILLLIQNILQYLISPKFEICMWLSAHGSLIRDRATMYTAFIKSSVKHCFASKIAKRILQSQIKLCSSHCMLEGHTIILLRSNAVMFSFWQSIQDLQCSVISQRQTYT